MHLQLLAFLQLLRLLLGLLLRLLQLGAQPLLLRRGARRVGRLLGRQLVHEALLLRGARPLLVQLGAQLLQPLLAASRRLLLSAQLVLGLWTDRRRQT